MLSTVTEFAKAKVNLALHVLGRRDDGYHDIDSIVAFASVADELAVTAAVGQGAAVSLTVSGPFAAAVPVDDSNLICRAHALLSEHVAIPDVRVQLTKNLPVAAGIGGGSADAAAAVRALLRLVGASVPTMTLQEIALKLGADVPVCLRQSTCRMEGVGEVISDVARLPAPAIVLVNPGVTCETAGVFKALGLAKGQRHLECLSPNQPELWRNDLMAPALAVQPVIGVVLTELAVRRGVFSVRMSGSGATCFGLARTIGEARAVAAELVAAHPGWWVMAAELS